jgi:hypothetical protein
MGFFESVYDFVVDIFKSVLDLFKDIFLWIFEMFVALLVFLIDLMPLPAFITDYRLTDFVPPELIFFLTMANFPQIMGMLASALVFRIIRRFLTLGIW